MRLLGKLRRAQEIAELLIEIAPKVREAVNEIREYRARLGRDAQVGDLDDSLAKLDALDRG